MNKNETAITAQEELERTGNLEIISKEEETREYEQIIKESNNKSEIIQKMREKEYSEFNIGFLLAMNYKMEELHVKSKPQIQTRRKIIGRLFKREIQE